jgi:hypothetical protein
VQHFFNVKWYKRSGGNLPNVQAAYNGDAHLEYKRSAAPAAYLASPP